MARVDSQKFLVPEVVFWYDVAHLPLTSSSSTSSWLITLIFFRTVNKQFSLTLVYKVLKNPVWCGLQVECAKMAETVTRDLQPLLWMEKTLSIVLPFTLRCCPRHCSRVRCCCIHGARVLVAKGDLKAPSGHV